YTCLSFANIVLFDKTKRNNWVIFDKMKRNNGVVFDKMKRNNRDGGRCFKGVCRYQSRNRAGGDPAQIR
ncbi:MAG: hypothetical protein LUB83_06630, partial [Prevotellaceae bacterium]|nr:hypothetical protein [Prevotellaceae bacterium]